MQLDRTGAYPGAPTTPMVPERRPDVGWSEAGAVTLRVADVADPYNEKTRYDYALHLTAEDIAAIFDVLANAALVPKASSLLGVIPTKSLEIAKLNLAAHGYFPGAPISTNRV